MCATDPPEKSVLFITVAHICHKMAHLKIGEVSYTNCRQQ